jgi:hypothetical protein
MLAPKKLIVSSLQMFIEMLTDKSDSSGTAIP